MINNALNITQNSLLFFLIFRYLLKILIKKSFLILFLLLFILKIKHITKLKALIISKNDAVILYFYSIIWYDEPI